RIGVIGFVEPPRRQQAAAHLGLQGLTLMGLDAGRLPPRDVLPFLADGDDVARGFPGFPSPLKVHHARALMSVGTCPWILARVLEGSRPFSCRKARCRSG